MRTEQNTFKLFVKQKINETEQKSLADAVSFTVSYLNRINILRLF